MDLHYLDVLGAARALAIILIIIAFPPSRMAQAMESAPGRMTVQNIIESRRILTWCDDADGICVSRDGLRYVIILGRGNLERDGIDIEVVSGRTASISNAIPRVVARLFTRGLGNTPITVANSIRWIDGNRIIAFLCEDKFGRKQVFSVDLDTGRMTQLTRHPSGIEMFAVSPTGSRIAYIATRPRDTNRSVAMWRNGYAVTEVDAYSYFDGNIDGWNRYEDLELFLLERGGNASPTRIEIHSVRGAAWPNIFEAGPNGEFLISIPRDNVPNNWNRYTDPAMRRFLLPVAMSNPAKSRITQLYILDRESRILKPLWDAPMSSRGSDRILWSPEGRSVILTGAFEPVAQASARGLDGTAVVEVDLATGIGTEIPIPATTAVDSLFPIRWNSDGVEFSTGQTAPGFLWFQDRGRRWKQLRDRPTSLRFPTGGLVRVGVRQNLDSPPIVYAQDDTGRERTVLEINPNLKKEHKLGRVELLQWRSADGLSWRGILYFPVNYSPGNRYPLVIQTHGYSETTFSLMGDDRFPTIFASQALANLGIAVVQMDLPEDGQIPRGWQATPREGPIMTRGMDGLITALVSQGLVDGSRVGLSGFSRTGLHVEYALTRSDFPYAAAIVADNVDQSYMQSAFQGWPLVANQGIGGEPFGEGLSAWLEEAPGFNADRIRTPLRLQVNSGGASIALSHWEMFSRLRRLNLPVELYIIPRMGEGTHNLQNPRQLLASAGGAVDWFDFWLNGHEDPDPAKADQYLRWRQLRSQRDAALQIPRRPLLDWHATPRTQSVDAELPN